MLATPATTPAGIAVKVHALDWCGGEGAFAKELRAEAAEGNTTNVRLKASILADALRLLGVEGI